MKHALFWLFLTLAAGIALGRTEFVSGLAPEVSAAAAAGLFLAAWTCARWDRIFVSCAITGVVAIGIFLSASSGNRILEKKWDEAVREAADRPVTFEGVVSEGRRRWTDDFGGERCTFTLSELTAAPSDRRVGILQLPGKIRVSGTTEALAGGLSSPLPSYGDRVRVTGTLSVPAGRTNPAGFDWKRFLTVRGTFATMRVSRVEPSGPPRGVKGAVYATREKLIRAMDAALSTGAADISKAIFLGERSELDPEFRRALVNTGTLHLFAISGFNVGFVAVILFGVCALARVPGSVRPALVLALLVGYAALVGENSPVVRAVIMAAFLIAADAAKTRVSSLQALGGAGTLMLFLNPEEAGDPSFRLSFAAVAGLAFVVPLWGTLQDVRNARSDRRTDRWRAALTLTVLTSAAAWVSTAPLIIHHFNRFSAVAPLINVLLVPVAFVLNLLLMIFAAASVIAPAAAGPLASAIEPTVSVLKLLVDRFDRVPGASWNLASWHAVTWFLFAAFGAWLWRRRRDIRRSLRVTLSVLALLTLIAADGVRAAWAAPFLRVTHFDAGQANAALIEAGGARVLIDTGRGGSADAGQRTLAPYLASLGASSVDLVLLTHPQWDHAGGLEGLLREVRVRSVGTNGDEGTAQFYQRTLGLVRERRIPILTLKRGDRVEGLPGGVRLRVLHPGWAPPSARADLNERSLVIELEAGDRRLIWTGDIGEEGLASALPSVPARPVDVLQVPHHGARTGPNAAELLRRTRPAVAVVSCGRHNGYGHPHASTIEALGRTAGRTHRTDLSGAFQWTMRDPQSPPTIADSSMV